MLSIAKVAAGPQAGQYYIDQVALGAEDYYAGKREEPGRWLGMAAADLQLEGDVDVDAFRHLLNGAGLRKPIREGAVGGIDLTFRAPKSVSVLWAVGDPDLGRELQAAHDVAVREALGYLESEACFGRRGAGGKIQVKGDGFVAAGFTHRASRAGDPLLHTHVIAGNLTKGPDERWTALDARHLYRQAKTAGYLYQAVLRAEVTDRTGLEWTPVDEGVADLRVVPRAVIEHFSERRQEILEHMAEHGGHSAASAQVAALETRRAKNEPPLERQLSEWRARAAEHGLTRLTIDRALQQPARHRWPFVPVDPQELTRSDSTFGRAEAIQHIAAAQPAGAHVHEIVEAADRTLIEEEIVRLADGPAAAGVTERRYSTRELLALERDLLRQADEGRGAEVGRVDRFTLSGAIEERGLSEQQREVVTDLCRSGDAISVLRAAAGTGKTFALDAARQAWEDQGHEVIGTALSARAARELEDQAAIPSLTIAQLVRRLDRGLLPQRTVLVVDEAGMVGTRDLAELADAVNLADGKLVLVGDDRQLPELTAGGAFTELAKQHPGPALTATRRQHEQWDRDALDQLRSGKVEAWARAYRDHGRITVADTARAVRHAVVNDWARADGDALMIASRRADVRDLNQLARQLLQADGRLGPDELTHDGRGYAAGDRIIGTENDRAAGLLNGQRGRITHADPERQTVTVALDNGTEATVDPAQVDHGYAITAHRAQGATVDRAFVLGSEDLYREWGYTALSRHRHEARFYIARTEVDLDPDLPDTVDPVIWGVTCLLERRHEKHLALDQLKTTDREQLEQEHSELRRTLERDPLPTSRSDPRELDAEAGYLWHVQQRRERLAAEREATPWWRRTRRTELDQLLERAGVDHDRLRDAVEQTQHDLAEDIELENDWLARHGDDAERLLGIDRELRRRGAIASRAREVGRTWRDRGLDRDVPGHDLDLDLDD